MNRPLTTAEECLIRWMLEHDTPEARAFLPQLEQAQVTPWRCACGCGSIHLTIRGYPERSGGFHPLAGFLFGSDEDLSGIFVYDQSRVLGGLEVYGFVGNVPKSLPSPESLR